MRRPLLLQRQIDDQTGVETISQDSHLLKLLPLLRFSFQALKKHGRTFFSIPDEPAVRGIRGSSCDSHDLGPLSLSSEAAIVSAFMRSQAKGRRNGMILVPSYLRFIRLLHYQ